METPLHAQKVTILSRLIKESSLTFEEALLLLKPEEEEKVEETQPSQQTITYIPGYTGTTIPYQYATNIPLTGTSSTIYSGSITAVNNTTTHADL
jgi:hypothetical protein